MTARILIAEDDRKQSEIIQLYLRREGYAVETVVDGQSAIDAVTASSFDVLVLDWMLPVREGIEVCRSLRATSEIAIIMLTARSTEKDLLSGLEAGADDYLTKPYSARELVARIKVLLRRTGGVKEPVGILRLGDLELDPRQFEARVSGISIRLTAREFAILEVFIQNPKRVFTRPEIVNQALDPDKDVTDRSVDAHIVNLRKKFSRTALGTNIVETVHGRGYRLGRL